MCVNHRRKGPVSLGEGPKKGEDEKWKLDNAL